MTYHMTWPTRAIALLILGIGISFFIGISSGNFVSGTESKALSILPIAAYILVGLWWALKVFTARVELSDQSIEVRNLFGRRSLPLDSIRGFRKRAASGKARTTFLKIKPINETMLILEFEEYFNFDSSFYEWFYSLPDLDEVDERK